MPAAIPHIAIAILNYNGRAHLEQYLPSLQQITYPNHSIWVIDNQSADDSVAFLQRHYPGIRTIQNGGNYGFAEGYNRGLPHISADYWLLLNSDVAVSPGFLEPLVTLMQAHPDVAFAQPKIRSHLSPTHFEYAGAAGGCMDALGYPFCYGRIFDHTEQDNGQYQLPRTIFWATGAALMARPSAFIQLGGFYAPFFMHNEEIDLCWRAQNMELKIAYCPQSEVFHLGGGSLQKESPRKTFFNFRNNLVMLLRNAPLARLLWLMPARLGLDLVAALQMIASGQSSNAMAVLKAWAWALSWIVKAGDEKWPAKRGLPKLDGYWSGSMVWRYFVRQIKTAPAEHIRGRILTMGEA